MGLVATLVAVIGVCLLVTNQGIPSFDLLDGKLPLVALLPGVYLFGLFLLRD